MGKQPADGQGGEKSAQSTPGPPGQNNTDCSLCLVFDADAVQRALMYAERHIHEVQSRSVIFNTKAQDAVIHKVSQKC